MFSITKSTYTGNNKILIEAVCLADDSKPTTGIANGSMCIVMDNGKIYAFNEAASSWVELQ